MMEALDDAEIADFCGKAIPCQPLVIREPRGLLSNFHFKWKYARPVWRIQLSYEMWLWGLGIICVFSWVFYYLESKKTCETYEACRRFVNHECSPHRVSFAMLSIFIQSWFVFLELLLVALEVAMLGILVNTPTGQIVLEWCGRRFNDLGVLAVQTCRRFLSSCCEMRVCSPRQASNCNTLAYLDYQSFLREVKYRGDSGLCSTHYADLPDTVCPTADLDRCFIQPHYTSDLMKTYIIFTSVSAGILLLMTVTFLLIKSISPTSGLFLQVRGHRECFLLKWLRLWLTPWH